MENNWKEELFKIYDNRNDDWENIEAFIESEIIEKLIEDAAFVADNDPQANTSIFVREQLRTKWLSKNIK